MGEDYEEVREEIADVLVPQGKECGQKIAEILQDRGHDRVIPLYRSAAVITVEKGERDVPYITVESYGDPHFWGAEDITEENVTEDPHEYTISGGRTGGLQIRHEGEKMMTKGYFEWDEEIKEKIEDE